MKTKNHPLTKRICALVLALWLMFLILLTWAVAQHFQTNIYDNAIDILGNRSFAHTVPQYAKDTPGYNSHQQIRHLSYPYTWMLGDSPLLPVVLPHLPKQGYDTDNWFYGNWELLYGYQAAVVYYDEAGAPLVNSGNLLTMSYITEKSWKAQTTSPQGFTYINLDKLSQGVDFLNGLLWNGPKPTEPSSFLYWIVRSTGYFKGEEFIPVTLDATMDLVSYEGSLDRFCKADSQNAIQWESIAAQEAPEGVPLVTIYARELGGISFHHKPISWDGTMYDSLVELAMDTGAYPYSRSLIHTVFCLGSKACDDTGAATYRIVVQSWPLGYAMLRMIPMYVLGTGLVLLALWWVLLRHMNAHFLRPLAHLPKAMQTGVPITPSSRWLEIRNTEEQFRQAQIQLRTLQNDNQQLRSALDYAKNAEQNRRQLVSSITHELKTPLAVIHSYAEGLQADIAGDKKEYYLQTILDESEKMDAMVLEMLDLSRLEAGKVRLSADHFSLLGLTQEILNKLSPEETRVHTIRFGYCNDCMITADEGRITQVVTNLISNALRYTAKGEHIFLRVFSDGKLAHFQMENPAPHLSQETLEKIFDTFYQADEARCEKGTGLGLPIARNIIALHRGTLTARNTSSNGKTHLEFAFEIPLG